MIPSVAQDFLDLFERLLPPAYLEPLREIGPGYEILQAYAKLFARCSTAVSNFDQQAFVITATGGSLAIGIATFSRPTADAGFVTIKAGTVLTASKSGRKFLTSKDAVMEGTSVTAPIVAEATGYEYNVAGPSTAANGTALPADIDTLTTLLTDPIYGDTTITLSSATATQGGLPALLDALGSDVGIIRSTGEPDRQFRLRVRALPDTVSPGAIRRAVAAAFATLGSTPVGTANFIELWQQSYQTAYDAPGTLPPTFVYDDPGGDVPYPGSGFPTRAAAGFFNRWLDDDRSGFIVTVPPIPAMTDVGMAYDDPSDVAVAPTMASFATIAGRRGVSAYDATSVLPGFGGLQGGYDGFDLQRAGVYLNLFNMLQRIKAAGVPAMIELQGQ